MNPAEARAFVVGMVLLVSAGVLLATGSEVHGVVNVAAGALLMWQVATKGGVS